MKIILCLIFYILGALAHEIDITRELKKNKHSGYSTWLKRDNLDFRDLAD